MCLCCQVDEFAQFNATHVRMWAPGALRNGASFGKLNPLQSNISMIEAMATATEL
jgi:hypothetical protein